jgi:hypothetical protein
MEKTKITSEMRIALRADFPKEAYKKHPTKTFLTTLKAMYVTERLNDVFGVGRWTIDIEIIERTADYVLVQGEFKSIDFEAITPKQFGGHKTSGTNTEIADGFKSAVTDCQSKIASYFEIGIDMFKGNISGNGIAPKKPQPLSPSLLSVIRKGNTQADLNKLWHANKELHLNEDFKSELGKRKKILTDNGVIE